MMAFGAFILFSIAIYLPLRIGFGDSSWLAAGHYPLVIQTSRILLYFGYFLAGVAVGAAGLRQGLLAEGGSFARRWSNWIGFALAFYASIVFLVFVHHSGLIDLKSPPLWWHTAYGLVFAMFCASMTSSVPAVFLRFAKSSSWPLDAMQKNAYGIYLLHFIPLIWMQYLVYDLSLPAFAKFAIVFAVTLSTSWAATSLLRRLPVAARMI
jgi:peptidoglycan/LPS O-acetylase OafA/YrhL